MPLIPRPNRDALSRGLDIYRDTMRPFILSSLEGQPGAPDNIVREGLPPGRRQNFNGDLKRADDLASAIDVGLFPCLVRGYWEAVFQKTFNRDFLVLETMQTIANARNRVAHPSTQDLNTEYADKHLNHIAHVLGRIGASTEQRAVIIITGDRVQAATQTAPQEPRVPTGEYHVYTDIPTRRSRIHQESCSYYRNRKEQTLDDNYWHGPYTTVTEAAEASRSDRDTRWDPLPCGHCRPEDR